MRKLNPFFIILTIVLFIGSCKKDNVTKDPVDPIITIEEKIAQLEETSGDIEKALGAGDQAKFLGFVSPSYEKYYKSAVQNNSAKLVQFNDVFKTRKLITCDGFYAVYEVQFNGKRFEISMILDENGKWKLKDL